VGWVRTGDHVAWVPLAPREVYYGRGNYGRYSSNITNVTINQVHVTNVYRNVNVTNSVTVVNQTTFLTGRHTDVHRDVVANVREDFVKRRNIVVGSPPIQPVEASRHPVVRSIPEAKRPPAAVRKIDVKELRQSRPLVMEPDRSAIRPQAQPRQLEVKKVDKPRAVSGRARERDQAAPAERGKPQQTAPPEMAKRQVGPDEKGKPQEARAEKGKQKEASAQRGKPKSSSSEKDNSKGASPDNDSHENPRGGTDKEGEKGRR
jgi:hypothetical protein